MRPVSDAGADPTPAADVRTAVRLGWAVAELRGRCWPDGPRPATSSLPERPAHTLPLRSQRPADAARLSAIRTLVSLAAGLQVPADDVEQALAPDKSWEEVSTYVFELDARIQDSLSTRSEAAANAYLLARGLAECYWGLGPDSSWRFGDEDTGVSLRFLFGPDRRRELTRTLGRMESGQIHPLSAAAIAGSIEAWGSVADDPAWAAVPTLRGQLYEQVRRWYQLVVLGQDPTTLVKPYARLSGPHGVRRALRLYRPQILLGFAALALIAAFFAVRNQIGSGWIAPLFGALGLGGVALTGLLARAKNTAEKLATRLRQDAYTDLVAVAVAAVPAYPEGTDRSAARTTAQKVEDAVRQRSLTTSTAAPRDAS